MGMVTLAIGSAPVGALLVGALADQFGVAIAIGGSSFACLVIVGTIAVRLGMFGRSLVAAPDRPGDRLDATAVLAEAAHDAEIEAEPITSTGGAR